MAEEHSSTDNHTASTGSAHPHPDPGNGHLRMPNELVDRLALLQLNGTQWRILWAVWRRTLCWQKRGEWGNEPFPISLGDLVKATGLARRQLARELKRLIGRGIVKRERGQRKSLLSFNLDYTAWQRGSDEIVTSDQLVTKSSARLDTSPVVNQTLPVDTKSKPLNKHIYKQEINIPRARSPRDAGVKAVLDTISQKLGAQIPFYAKEGAAVKRALQMGYTEDQIIACWERMKSFAFWQGKWLPLAKVAENLGEFAAGRLSDGKQSGKGVRPKPDQERTRPITRIPGD